MSAELLLQQFDRIIQDPIAAPHLRGFAISLAVQGRLTSPAAPPLTQAASEVCEQAVLPSGWRWVRLADLTPQFQNGTSSRRGDSSGRSTIVLRLADIKDGRISVNDPRRIPLTSEARAKYQLASGDILVVRVNGSSDLVGRFILNDRDEELAYCDHFIRLRVDPQLVLPAYLRLVGDSDDLRRQVTSLFVTSAGQKTVNQTHVSSLIVPLPPLAEQCRIITKANELLELCDELEAAKFDREAARDRLRSASLRGLATSDKPKDSARLFLRDLPRMVTKPEHVTGVRQAILDAAVRGRLSPAGTGGLERRLKVGAVAPLQNGYAFKSEWFAAAGVRLLRNANVGHGTVGWQQAVRLPDSMANEFARFALKEGDVVLSLDRPFIATGTKVARVRSCDLPSLLLQRVGRFKVNPDRLDPDFLFLWVESPAFAEQVDPGRSNGVPHISSKQVENAEILVPSLPEQRRIVAKVGELMAMCDDLEGSLAAEQTERARLLTALLRDALNDRLVPRQGALLEA